MEIVLLDFPLSSVGPRAMVTKLLKEHGVASPASGEREAGLYVTGRGIAHEGEPIGLAFVQKGAIVKRVQESFTGLP
jgi:hypothetical protein